jgi:DNA-binding NarL/FixJ family response regulator
MNMAAQASYLDFTKAQPLLDSCGDLESAVRLLHEGCLRDDKHWDAFEAALCTRFHATHAMFALVRLDPSAQQRLILDNNPPARPTTIQFRNALELMRRVFAEIPQESPISLEDLARHHDPDVRSNCAAWLANPDNPQLIALDTPCSESTVAMLRLIRPRSVGNLTEYERAELRSLAPHTRTAASVFLRVQRLLGERTLLTEELLPATILIDRSGTVVQMNDSARSLLAHENAVSVEQGRIKILHANESRAFQQMLSRAARALEDGREPLVDALRMRRTSSGSPLWVVARSLAVWPDRIAIMFYTEDDEPDVPLEALQHLLGLTRSETAVALRLARGKTVKEITEELGISLSTTRTHLRSIFAKTCIDKQTKLVRTVLQGVAMLTCR